MKIYNSYKETFRVAMATQQFAVARLNTIQLPMNIDTSGCYKLFFFLSGEKKFHIDDFIYDVHPGDLFFVNQREWHYFSNIKKECDHDRIVIFIYPDFLKRLSTEQTNLCRCFNDRTNPHLHQINLSISDREKFNQYICKLSDCGGFGQDIIASSTLAEILVFLHRIMFAPMGEKITPISDQLYALQNRAGSIGNIIEYIDDHITEELSLSRLAKTFFISQSYLCRVFKDRTGTTIHKYITAKRITLAKDLLSQGYSVTDACNFSGFGDYNAFLRSFVDAVGIPPKKYAKLAK